MHGPSLTVLARRRELRARASRIIVGILAAVGSLAIVGALSGGLTCRF